MNKISFVCTTYRRFTCVERIIAQFYAQRHPNKELIIFNTDMEHPMALGFPADDIVLINNNTDYETGLPYTNRGQICRDAVTHATGDYFMLADDDDIYLPWHMQQAYERITRSNTDAWKPRQSFFATQDKIMLVQNTLEASVIVKMHRIREIGFRMDLTGYEGLSWYTKLQDERQLVEHDQYYVPSYCFNWSDPHEIAGHKQSGDINNPENFENHKKASLDWATRSLQNTMELTEVYVPYYEFLYTNKNQFPRELMERYVYFPTKNLGD
jgi:hypothetical protein